MCQSIRIDGLPGEPIDTPAELAARLPAGIAWRADAPATGGDPVAESCTCWVDVPATARRNGYVALRNWRCDWVLMRPAAHEAREAMLEAIDDLVDAWHEGGAPGGTLRAFLGMSEEGYEAWSVRCEVPEGWVMPKKDGDPARPE